MALTENRNTPRIEGDLISGLVAAATTIFAGALVMRTATGYLTEGATALGSIGVGRAEEEVANAGVNGAETIKVRPGIFQFKNSSAGDAITIAEIGDVCFIVDDETVAKTDGTGTRSPAGFVHAVDAQGVWVRFDEAMLRTYAVTV